MLLLFYDHYLLINFFFKVLYLFHQAIDLFLLTINKPFFLLQIFLQIRNENFTELMIWDWVVSLQSSFLFVFLLNFLNIEFAIRFSCCFIVLRNRHVSAFSCSSGIYFLERCLMLWVKSRVEVISFLIKLFGWQLKLDRAQGCCCLIKNVRFVSRDFNSWS